MNFISQILQKKSQTSRCALIPFITAGYPNIDTTIQLLYTLDNEGADLIELGIPYADALADGPLIQHSSNVALNQGIYIDQVLFILKKVYLSLSTPIIIFSYYNPILSRGIEKFLSEINKLGVKGLIIPDLPVEETDFLLYLCSELQIELILFIAPTSSNHRIMNIISKAPGCLYLVNNTGVTGVRNTINRDVSVLLDYIKSKTNKFIMLGFGISNKQQVAEISKWNIDGIVIGSALISIISHYIKSDNKILKESLIKDVGFFCKDIKSSC